MNLSYDLRSRTQRHYHFHHYNSAFTICG